MKYQRLSSASAQLVERGWIHYCNRISHFYFTFCRILVRPFLHSTIPHQNENRTACAKHQYPTLIERSGFFVQNNEVKRVKCSKPTVLPTVLNVTFLFSPGRRGKKSSISACVACMGTCTSPYLLPYLLPVPFLGCISLLADTGSDPFIRKQIRCRWPTSQCRHLYSAATMSEEEGLFIDQHWDLALDQNLCPQMCLRELTNLAGSWYHFDVLKLKTVIGAPPRTIMRHQCEEYK